MTFITSGTINVHSSRDLPHCSHVHCQADALTKSLVVREVRERSCLHALELHGRLHLKRHSQAFGTHSTYHNISQPHETANMPLQDNRRALLIVPIGQAEHCGGQKHRKFFVTLEQYEAISPHHMQDITSVYFDLLCCFLQLRHITNHSIFIVS